MRTVERPKISGAWNVGNVLWRFPEDQFLRERGWMIYTRRKGKPAEWIYKNTVMTHAEALEAEQYEKHLKRTMVMKDGA